MHTQNLYFINKYFQLCESGTEEEDCNICEQNQVSLDTPSENQPGLFVLISNLCKIWDYDQTCQLPQPDC